MANLNLSLIEDDIVAKLDTITDVTGNVSAATIPDMDIDDIIHPPGILVAFESEDWTTAESQPVMSNLSRKCDSTFHVLVVARTMRTDPALGPGLHGIMAEVKDKLLGQNPSVVGAGRPYMYRRTYKQRVDKDSQKVGYILEFDTLVIVKKQ